MDATKGDYFLTQLLAFFNGISQPGQTEKGMAFFLDTPSDAQKNYIMSVPAIDVKRLWNYKNSGDAIAVARFVSLITEKLNIQDQIINELQEAYRTACIEMD